MRLKFVMQSLCSQVTHKLTILRLILSPLTDTSLHQMGQERIAAFLKYQQMNFSSGEQQTEGHGFIVGGGGRERGIFSAQST